MRWERREVCGSREHCHSRRRLRHRRCRRLGRGGRGPCALARRIGSRRSGYGRGTEERTPGPAWPQRASRTAGRTRRVRNPCAHPCICWSGWHVSNSQVLWLAGGHWQGTSLLLRHQVGPGLDGSVDRGETDVQVSVPDLGPDHEQVADVGEVLLQGVHGVPVVPFAQDQVARCTVGNGVRNAGMDEDPVVCPPGFDLYCYEYESVVRNWEKS